jgi:hypothetical protein
MSARANNICGPWATQYEPRRLRARSACQHPEGRRFSRKRGQRRSQQSDELTYGDVSLT